MAARRQRLAELGRDDAAAADRGIADDPMFIERLFIRLGTDDRLAHDNAFGPGDAGERAELRVAAFDELPEQRRVQPRRGGAGRAALELAGVAIERRALAARNAPTRRPRTTASRESLMK